MSAVFEERAIESGNVTATQLKNMFDDFQATVSKYVQETINTMRSNVYDTNDSINMNEGNVNIVPLTYELFL